MASSLRADLGVTVTRRLEAESISVGLGTELAMVWGTLRVESDEHDLLCITVGVVFNDLGLAQPEGTISLGARARSLRRMPSMPGSPKPLLSPIPITIKIST